MDLFDYPNSPGHKRAGTAQKAAEAVSGRAPTIKVLVLKALQQRPMTPDEAADMLGLSLLAVRPRFSELGKLGRIVRTGQTRKNASGLDADVWTVTNV